MFSNRFLLLLALGGLAAAMFSQAQSLPAPNDLSGNNGTQIVWASDAFALNLMADGITTFEASEKIIHFELGTFQQGFDPTTATPSQWQSHWVYLQATTYNNDDQQFIETATLAQNTEPFHAGAQAYIWGYISKDLSQGPSEWILIAAPSWKLPAYTTLLPTTYSVSDALPQHVIIGSLGGTMAGYHMQLATVPEPSSSILALGGMVSLLLRRRR